jgi:hypothetical protein
MRNWIDNVFSPGCQIGDSSRHPLSLFGSLFPQPEDSGCGFYLLCLLGWSAAGFGADIRSTMHNLTRKGLTVAAEEVCVFCHTPQLSPGPAGSALSAQPAWQPSLSNSHSFVIFDDIGRMQFGDRPAGSQSIACLSCHDANQAFSVQAAESDHPFGIPYRGFTKGRERLPQEELSTDAAPSRPRNI